MRARLRVTAIYLGAILGPLGGGVVSPMLPRIGQSLSVSSSTAALAMTVYLVPFAAVQLISGTLGERWGRRNTVLVAYLVYLVAAVGAALAPNIGIFLLARAILGTANAFTSPLLLAGLADVVPSHRLGRSVGLFASCQAAGQSFAPLVGGLAAAVSWRWAFIVVAGITGLLALAPPPGGPRPGAQAPRWRPLVNTRMALLSTAAFVSYLGAAALPFLVALYAQEHLHLRPDVTGLTLLGFGVAGMLLGAVWGSLMDRYSARWCGAIAAALTGVAVASVGLAQSAITLAMIWTGAGVVASLLNVALQHLTVRAVPDNRGGALSAVSAFRFAGGALAPLLVLPFYQLHAWLSFMVAGATLLVATAALLLLRRDVP